MNYYKLLSSINEKDKTCIVVNDMEYTYKDVIRDSDALADEIYNCLKPEKSTVVAVLDKDVYFEFTAFFALNKLEMIPLILHPSTPYHEVIQIMKKNNIMYIIKNENIQKLYSSDNFETKNVSIDLKICTNAALTSGSTGIPKVLYRTYKSWTGFFDVQNKVFNITKNSVLFFHGPLSFTGNLNSILSVIFEGGTIVTYEGFNPRRWLEFILKYNVNTIYLVPVKLMALNRINTNPIKTIKSIFTGSMQLSADIKDNLLKYYPSANVILYYGASELNYITYASLEDIIKNPLSVGKPFERVKVKIKDGYIYVKSDYFVFGEEEWATVKDIGFIKDDELIFEGRGSDFFNKNGNTISLSKIQFELNQIDYIKDLFVTSYKDKLQNDDVAVFIIPNKYVSKSDLRKDFRKHLLSYEMPRKIFILDKFPLNDSGKIDKKKLIFNFIK